MTIKNIIFDIGNVIVKWSPPDIIKKVFPESPELKDKIFKTDTWYDLNLGKITERQAIEIYHNNLAIPYENLEVLMAEIKYSQIPLEGSLQLLDDLDAKGIPLYCLTDNIREVVAFLKEKYTFFKKFKGEVVSAEIGALKPAEFVYQYLLNTYQLKPEQTLFFDDTLKNVEGAKKVGIVSYHFTDALSCRALLQELHIL